MPLGRTPGGLSYVLGLWIGLIVTILVRGYLRETASLREAHISELRRHMAEQNLIAQLRVGLHWKGGHDSFLPEIDIPTHPNCRCVIPFQKPDELGEWFERQGIGESDVQQ